MKLAAVITVGLALCGCQTRAPRASTQVYALPSLEWVGPAAVRLPLDSVSELGAVDFYVVTLRFNGVDTRFMVDTGSNVSWVTTDFCRSQGAHFSGEKMFSHGVGGNSTQPVIHFDRVDLGFAVLRGLSVVSGPILTDMNRMLKANNEAPIAGIIGLDILVPLRASLNLGTSEIVFEKSPNQSLQPTAFSVTPRAGARVAPEKAVAEH